MKKFALATATALTMAMAANVAFAQTSQAPMTLAAGEVTKAKESTSDTWITTKVKADLLTEKGIPGSDIKVETNKGVVTLSSDVEISESQKATAVAITRSAFTLVVIQVSEVDSLAPAAALLVLSTLSAL